MRPKNEAAVCSFVRRILSLATGSAIKVTDQPDRQRRSTKEVEELWASASHRFAIEHTLVESFVRQLYDDAAFMKLFGPIEAITAGFVPGTYVLQVEAGASASARVRYQDAALQIAGIVLRTAPVMAVGDPIQLPIGILPFPVYMGRRSASGSKVLVRRFISEVEESRLARVRTALQAKCPKLSKARANGRLSVLALESNDIALANYSLVTSCARQALSERNDVPDISILVETDAGPLYGWTIGNRTDIPLRHNYFEGDLPEEADQLA